MRALYITLILIVSQTLYADNQLAWVDKQITAIKPPRVGISNKEISQIKDPFIYLVKKKKTIKKVFKHSHYIRRYYTRRFYLEAILNKSAMINRKWYKKGEWVHGYKLINVNKTSVILQRRNKKLLLSTESKNKNLKFKISQ